MIGEFDISPNKDLVINLNTARELGLTMPPSFSCSPTK